MARRRSFKQLFLFLGIVVGVLFAGHFYIAKRMILDPGIEDPWRGLLLGGVVLLFALLFLVRFADRWFEPSVVRILAWPAWIWMGFSFLLITALGISDALLWVVTSDQALAALDGSDRQASLAGARAGVVGLVVLAASSWALRSGLRPPAVRRVDLELARWPRALDGFRIVQVSDIHLGTLIGRAFAEQLVARINALSPDVVAITGDLASNPAEQLTDAVAPFGGLSATHGVFFVTGNHEYYAGVKAWVAALEKLGVRVLRNERVEIGVGDDRIDLVGVDDHRGAMIGGEDREDLERALEGRDPNRAAVLLAHDPSTFKRSSTRGIDLQLSGHTHGGQIWPFVYLVRLVVPYVAGHYRANGAQLYVSRGTGFWGPPMRLLAPAEITELIIRGAAADQTDLRP